jgi:hypothetical protein
MVRNLSNAGAALDVTSPVGIPEHFTLVLGADGHHMPCHVVWSQGEADWRGLRLKHRR